MRFLVLLLMVAACVDAAEPGGPQVTSGVVRHVHPVSANRKLDVLLVVDSTPAMAPYRDALRANLRRFAEDMRATDLRVGAITAAPADDAILHGAAGLDAAFVSDAFGSAPGQRVRNYTGDLADIVERIGDVGTQGATASPLAMAQRFFARDTTFLRADAATAIFIVTASELPEEPVAPYAEALRALHPDPSRTIVGGVGPGDRLAAFLDLFPNRNARARITDADWSNVSRLIPGLAKMPLGAPCITSSLLDADAGTAGIQPVCNAWYDYPGGSEILPACTTAPDGECWRLVSATPACMANHLLEIDHRRVEFPANATLTIECLTTR